MKRASQQSARRLAAAAAAAAAAADPSSPGAVERMGLGVAFKQEPAAAGEARPCLSVCHIWEGSPAAAAGHAVAAAPSPPRLCRRPTA
jgi:hypothetical protein